jgi:hypothetical protein
MGLIRWVLNRKVKRIEQKLFEHMRKDKPHLFGKWSDEKFRLFMRENKDEIFRR